MNTKLLRQLALGMAIGTALAACDRDTKDVAVAPPPAPQADESMRQAPTPVPPGMENPATALPPATPTEPANPATNLPGSSSVGPAERAPLPAEEKREQEAQPTPGTPETKPEIRQERGAAPGTASQLAEGDRAFVIAALSDGMAAMEAARLAAGKGESPRVKAFAEDHTVVGEATFTPVAGRNEVTLRTERRATSVESVGCTTPDQPRPR